jgi:hypothetical protein
MSMRICAWGNCHEKAVANADSFHLDHSNDNARIRLYPGRGWNQPPTEKRDYQPGFGIPSYVSPITGDRLDLKRAMMTFTALQNVLWGSGFIGHVVLLAVLIFRRQAKTFPVFTAWTAYQIVDTISLFLVSRVAGQRIYFDAYWLFAFGDYALQFGLIYEIARDVLRPTGSWIQDARSWFFLWGSVGLLLAAGLALKLAPAGSTGFEIWTARSWIFVSLVTCELYLSMCAAANRLGLQWRSHVMALGEGLALWAAASLLADAAQYIAGWGNHVVLFSNIRSSVYICSLIFWIFSFASREPEREPLSDEMQEYLCALHNRIQYDLETIKPTK